MIKEKTFQISLDPELIIIQSVYDAINDKLNLTKLIKKKINKTNTEFAFSCICAILDRIYDTVKYLEEIKLVPDTKKRHAFDFCDFINNAYVLVDCIDKLAEIVDCNLNKENSCCNIFKKAKDEYGGEDYTYFKHLRSISSVHPANTSFYKKYYKGTFACSPFVEWRCKTGDPNQLYVWIYENESENKNEFSFRCEGINIYEIFEYIKCRYNILEKLIPYIKEKQKKISNELKQRDIKNIEEFDSYIDYLENLKKEEKRRYPSSEPPFDLDFAIKYFKLKLSNSKNIPLYEKYGNALRYAIQFRHNKLQNMSYVGFNNSGIKYNEEGCCIDSDILNKLYHLNSTGKFYSKYHISINKTLEALQPTNPHYPFNLEEYFKKSKPFFRKYVFFQNVKYDFEKIALIKMALYQNCLENDCVVNRNIPNDLKYRFKLL